MATVYTGLKGMSKAITSKRGTEGHSSGSPVNRLLSATQLRRVDNRKRDASVDVVLFFQWQLRARLVFLARSAFFYFSILEIARTDGNRVLRHSQPHIAREILDGTAFKANVPQPERVPRN